MKLRMATMLSLAGVLSAGSAAALVNSHVLQSTEANADGGVTIGAANAVTDTVIDSATQIQSSVLTSTQVMFQVGDAGVVTLDTAGNVLTVVSATASAGWVVVNSETNGSAAAEVTFQSASSLVEFTAQRLDDGSIATAVGSNNFEAEATTNGDADDSTNTDVNVGVTGEGDVNGDGVDITGDVGIGIDFNDD